MIFTLKAMRFSNIDSFPNIPSWPDAIVARDHAASPGAGDVHDVTSLIS
jgi:hypothetical protein